MQNVWINASLRSCVCTHYPNYAIQCRNYVQEVGISRIEKTVSSVTQVYLVLARSASLLEERDSGAEIVAIVAIQSCARAVHCHHIARGLR